jgi:hypothetical protein
MIGFIKVLVFNFADPMIFNNLSEKSFIGKNKLYSKTLKIIAFVKKEKTEKILVKNAESLQIRLDS